MKALSQFRHTIRSPLRLAFVILWLLLLFAPCLALWLASQGELRIRTGPEPQEETRLWLVQEAKRAGLALSWVTRHDLKDRTCFQTEARFLLWRGQQLDDETATSYCSCYDLQDEGRPQQELSPGACPSSAGSADD